LIDLGLGDGPPATNNFLFNYPFNVVLNKHILRCLTLKVFEFAENF
jgi:hypothetical protein